LASNDNALIDTGDGIALALRAGVVQDIEMAVSSHRYRWRWQLVTEGCRRRWLSDQQAW
jgi:succinate dehydrogenase/fumarate reductase flavoprotein subunit